MTLESAIGSDQPQVDAIASEVAEALASSVSADLVAVSTAESEPEQVETSELAQVSGAVDLKPVDSAPEQSSLVEAGPSALADDAAVEQSLPEAVLADPGQPEPAGRFCIPLVVVAPHVAEVHSRNRGGRECVGDLVGNLDQLADYLKRTWTDSIRLTAILTCRSQERMPNLVS